MATKDFKVKNGLTVAESIRVDSGSIIVAGLEVINSSGGVVGVYQGFDSDFSSSILNTTTDSLSEGLNNLYYTTSRVDSAFDARLATKTTNDVTEGSNLYYTTARVDSAFDARLATKTTDDLTEGSNQYYTDTKVQTYLSNNSYATLSNIDSAIAALVDAAPSQLDTLNELAAAINDDSNFAATVNNQLSLKLNTADFSSTANTWISGKSTSDLSEGSNLYYTTSRVDSAFDARLATKTTSDLTEGSNLYYTKSRADSDITFLINSSYIENLRPAEVIFEVSNNLSSSYSFLGDGFPVSSDNPDLYVQKGMTYKFKISTTGHPFEIRTSAGGSAYSSGVTNNSIQSGDIIFTVPMDAPDTLYYQCTIHSGMGGTIYVTEAASITTDTVSEGSANLYYTDSRADARIGLQTGANLDLSQKSTTDLSEGTNLYYTDSRADTRISAASVGDLSDVDLTTTAPTDGQVLKWNPSSSTFIPGDAASSISNLTDVNLTGLINNAILKYNSVNGEWVVATNNDTANATATAIVPFAFIRVTANSSTSGTAISHGTFTYSAGSDCYVDFTFTNAQANANYHIITDYRNYGDVNYAIDITNITTSGFRANFYDQDNTYDPVTIASVLAASPTFIIYAETPTQSITSTVGSIDDLSDVDTTTTTPTAGQVLVWDDANSVWKPGTVTGGSGTVDSAQTIALITDTVDSAYIQARQLIGGGSGTVDSAQTIALITDTVDSAYIAERGGIYYLDTFGVSEYKFTADSNQTIFNGIDDNGNTLAFNSNNYQVFINGVKITSADYSANSLTDTITLTDPASYQDEVLVTVYNREQGATNVTLVDSAWLTNLVSTTYAGTASVETYFFTADSGQITFSGIDDNGQTLSYSSGNIQVFVNGVAIVNGLDFTATNGSSIVLDIPADSGDQVLINDFGALYSTNLGLDSSSIINLIDSAYIQSRSAGGTVDSAQTIALITDTIDSAYIQARQLVGGGSGTVDSAQTIALITDTIDSAYIQARVEGGIQYLSTDHYFQNYKFISDSGQTIFTGSDFNGSVLAFDSSEFQIYINGIRITDVDYTANPINDTITLTTGALQDDEVVITTLKVRPGSPVSVGGGVDSAQTITLITDTVDSAYINSRIVIPEAGVDSSVVSSIVSSIVDSDYVLTVFPQSNIGISTVGFYRFTATSGQTIFSGTDVNGNALQYEIGSVLVYYNGSLIAEGADFTANTGGSITLAQGAVAGDDIFIVNHKQTFYGGGAAPGLLLENFYYTATSGQLTFSGTDTLGATLNYKPGNIQVYLNGLILRESVDYTATNGTSVVLTSAAGLNDELTVAKISQSSFNGSYWREVSNNYTAAAGQRLVIDTSTNSIQISLPPVAAFGDEIRIIDGTGNAANNNIVILHNGHKIQGSDSDLTVDVNEAAFGLVYYNNTRGWILTEK